MDHSWSDEEIASLGEKVRKFLKLGPSDRLDVYCLIRAMRENPNRLARIAFVPASDEDLKFALARAEPQDRIVRYKPDLMERVKEGDAKASEVLLEEIGHTLMHPSSMALDHAAGKDLRALNNKSVERKEREAEKFVWFTLAPISEVYGEEYPERLRAKYGLTLSSAEAYIQHIRRTKNRIEKSNRPLPGVVINFLTEAKERGYSVKTNIELDVGVATATKEPEAVKTSEPSAALGSGFLSESCENCHEKTLRMLGGCKQCFSCGENQGCA